MNGDLLDNLLTEFNINCQEELIFAYHSVYLVWFILKLKLAISMDQLFLNISKNYVI